MPPPQPLTLTVNEYVAALVGVPARLSEIGLLEAVIATPAGSVPEVMVQVAGAQPPVVAMTAEYEVFTVPFGYYAVTAQDINGQESSKCASVKVAVPNWPGVRMGVAGLTG